MGDIVAMDVDMLEAEQSNDSFRDSLLDYEKATALKEGIDGTEDQTTLTDIAPGIKSPRQSPSAKENDDDANAKQDEEPRPNVLFLYGLDEMSTRDIKTYCKGLNLEQIEWINDSSCNLVFPTEEEARAAAGVLLEQEGEISHTILRKTKTHTRDDRVFENLHIRIATTADVKERGARERSRYYLLYGTEESVHDRPMSSDDHVPVTSRLGARRERDERDVFSRLGRRRDDSYGGDTDDRRHSRRRERPRRRSMSPVQRKPVVPSDVDDKIEDNDLSSELPESLKGRLGPRQTPA
ncbi:hypothetical protein DFQ28_003575 [Apophysomyces sp. BC1034]|nr:hypothetical protein DFQ30_010728 [Apophysomyces sp. BC1015]KAG0181314.1 hypothetical protein DFQ29_008674 [Apophysomyces sp. BC1021]KAG0189319.1 hypothetical protein DFQ28_003575 [Apophysomyces sp. BC1034]